MMSITKNASDSEFSHRILQLHRVYNDIGKLLMDWAEVQKETVDTELQRLDGISDKSAKHKNIDSAQKKEWLSSFSKQQVRTLELAVVYTKKAIQALKLATHNSRKVKRHRRKHMGKRHGKGGESTSSIDDDPDGVEVEYIVRPLVNLAVLYERLDNVSQSIDTYKEALSYADNPVCRL